MGVHDFPHFSSWMPDIASKQQDGRGQSNWEPMKEKEPTGKERKWLGVERKKEKEKEVKKKKKKKEKKREKKRYRCNKYQGKIQ